MRRQFASFTVGLLVLFGVAHRAEATDYYYPDACYVCAQTYLPPGSTCNSPGQFGSGAVSCKDTCTGQYPAQSCICRPSGSACLNIIVIGGGGPTPGGGSGGGCTYEAGGFCPASCQSCSGGGGTGGGGLPTATTPEESAQ